MSNPMKRGGDPWSARAPASKKNLKAIVERSYDDECQFGRLLAEIRACGLNEDQYEQLQGSMDLSREAIDAILFSAEVNFELEKRLVTGGSRVRAKVVQYLLELEQE